MLVIVSSNISLKRGFKDKLNAAIFVNKLCSLIVTRQICNKQNISLILEKSHSSEKLVSEGASPQSGHILT